MPNWNLSSPTPFASAVSALSMLAVVAGPFASYQLSLMGAEVIRIDRIVGNDFVRFHGGTNAMKEAGLGASYID